ncbi:MAG TPA: molybdopterin-synthase adenylyltransferase MoeB [Micropepsaceae bacterium]|jgi:adenylyltransferase/sulfurtransferase|nr:molybdopterin-synthase adenylyltransferase MoeB [Micropepsaceae bacterium]
MNEMSHPKRPPLQDEQLERYARHIVLREVGGAGQARLLAAKVLVIGAGGLGSPLILYLAAAGVGTIGVVDFDRVSLSNLQRQIAHRTQDVGRLKTESAGDSARSLNPDVTLIPHAARLTADNAAALIGDYDIVADGSDNFATRFLVNDACFFARKPLVSAAVTEFDGQLATYKAWDKSAGLPCYRCLFAEPPPAGTAPNCSETGVLGAVAGVMGTLQAVEILKEIVGAGDSLAGRLLIYDALAAQFRNLKVPPDPACRLCGSTATIVDLSMHREPAGPACLTNAS